MARLRHLLSGCALAACVSPALAQSPYNQPAAQPGYVNPFAPQSDADQLAHQMRLVAANPTDLYALLNAAKLSLKVGDTDAAAALYTRAERVNPVHPQVKAGMARLLVQSGRPGAALRKFEEAERLGATLNDFGPDRALAYDLIGEQQRAQREYRALLRLGADDETTRRYALSLGISGLKDPALALLEPLNRRSDRGAWRARAFVLAMNGDRSGADKIATTMMPPGMAQGLAPFFDRLPRLSATERAFAVSFGETRASPTRLADARLAPALPALSPEPNPFPQVRTQVAAVEDVDDGKKKKKRRSRKDKPEPVRLARQPYVAPLPAPPAPTATQLAALTASRAPSGGTFMPAQTSGKVTVLPPPPEAYRGPVTQVAAKPANPAEGDEPDFAVAAVSALAGTQQPATKQPAPPPTALAANTATPAPVRPTAAPPASVSTPSAAATTGAASNSLFGDRPATGTNFSLAGARPATPSPAVTTPPPPSPPASANAAPAATAAADLMRSQAAPATGGTVAAPGFTGLAGVAPTPNATAEAGSEVTTAPPAAALAATTAPTTDPAAVPAATTTAAITPTTGAPPAPEGARGDDALAAIVAGIKIPDAELAAPIQGVPPPAAAPAGTRLLANIDAKAAATTPAAKPAVKAEAAKLDPTLPKKDARGRFVDEKGKLLFDPQGRPMGPKGAAAWQLAQSKRAEADEAGDAPTLPKRNAQGRFVDAKGKPLLDERGRPMGPKGAAAWQLAQNKKAEAEPADDAPALPKKDARGRFVDAKGKPLLDDRGRPMGPKGAAAWQLAQNKKGGADDEDTPAKGKPDPTLPKKDARGRFVDDKGKPLLDARGRAMTETAARAWKTAQAKEAAAAKKEAAAAKGEPQRYWVQVAGGANEATLGREWARVSAATPSLKGKSGWTTPLRATNRILTGPFKTSAEAMATVNQLKKEGLSAFMFTSDAGQKVTRLGGK